IARCVCRRAERKVLAIDSIGKKSRICARYLNRLSDYLFVLSRKLTKDFKITEIHWHPGSKK
ncbi:MAG: ATP:cob(I)alamin adenosyltransferase, partial [Bacteroidales bacterium]|nr:ATP:cob(I)alamin adenosyltransferase [Bacteroidales bacterium]